MSTMDFRRLVSFALVLSVAGGCEHDPELDRVGGGPLPELDASGDAKLCPPFDPGISTPALPCDVEAILVAKCQRCHSDPPQHAAPFKLTTWEDTQASYAGKPVHERMHSAVDKGQMPYMGFLDIDPPVEPLTPDEKSRLLEWLTACAPPVESAACP
jgi:hypothetical protein